MRAASSATEYRQALAAGDTTRAAAAVAGMWRGRLTEDRLRGLNARLKVEADEQTVAAVVIEVARLQKGGEPAVAQAQPPVPNGYRLLNWLASNYRPPQSMQTAPEVPIAAEVPKVAAAAQPAVPTPVKETRPRGRTAVKAAPPKTERARPVENPAVAYETALLARDATGMARAVTRLTRGPVTAETIRKLNAEIGAEPDETLVQAVVEAAPTAKAN